MSEMGDVTAKGYSWLSAVKCCTLLYTFLQDCLYRIQEQDPHFWKHFSYCTSTTMVKTECGFNKRTLQIHFLIINLKRISIRP